MTLRYIPPDESSTPNIPSQGSRGPLIASLPAEIDVPISAALRELDQILSPPAGYWSNHRAIFGLIDLLQMIPESWPEEIEIAAHWIKSLRSLPCLIAEDHAPGTNPVFARTKQPILHLATFRTDTHRLWALQLIFAYREHLADEPKSDRMRRPYEPSLAVRQIVAAVDGFDLDPHGTPSHLREVCLEHRQSLQTEAEKYSTHASSLLLFIADAPMRNYSGRTLGEGNVRVRQVVPSWKDSSGDEHFVRESNSGAYGERDVFRLSKSKAALLKDDLDPSSTAVTAYTVLEIEDQANLEKAVAAYRSDHRYRARDFSELPFHRSNLQPDQLRQIANLVQRATGGELCEEEELYVLVLGVALEFSRSIETVCSLDIHSEPKGTFSLLTVPELRFDLPVIRPAYRRIRDVEVGENSIVRRHSLAPSKPLRTLLARRLIRKQSADNQLFEQPSLAKKIRRYLKLFCPDAPISPGSLAQFGRNTVAAMAGSDKTVAAILFGLDEGLHKTQIFYECKALDELHALHKAYQRILWASAPCEVRPKADAERVVIALRKNETPRLSIGCSSVPSLKIFRFAIDAEKSALMRVEQMLMTTDSMRDLIQEWNKAICFLLHHQATAIGGRTTGDVYIPSGCFNREHIAYFGDKTDEQGYRVRVLKIPPRTHAQMVWCERWIRSLSTRFGLEPTGLPFLLDRSGNPTRLSARKFELATQSWFPFPSNTPRRVMANLLRDACVSHEAVNFFLGHAQFGREAWRASSAVALNQLFDELDRVVPLILDDLGFSTWWPQ